MNTYGLEKEKGMYLHDKIQAVSRREIFSNEEYYHLYNRGTEKRDIFLDHADYRRFLALLYICNSSKPVHFPFRGTTLKELFSIKHKEKLVQIGAFCLMPNHFHILIREKTDGISKFMQKLCTGYTMYFNKRYQRTGALFQGKFKSKYVSDDTYLKHLYAYIHLNPIKLIQSDWKEEGIKDHLLARNFLESYQYSSYNEYTSLSPTLLSSILTKDAFPKYFTDPDNFARNTTEWLTYNTDNSVLY